MKLCVDALDNAAVGYAELFVEVFCREGDNLRFVFLVLHLDRKNLRCVLVPLELQKVFIGNHLSALHLFAFLIELRHALLGYEHTRYKEVVADVSHLHVAQSLIGRNLSDG